MVFIYQEVPFPAKSDRRSRVAGNGTECEVKTIELSSLTSGGEQWPFLNFIIFIAVKKTALRLRKRAYPNMEAACWCCAKVDGGTSLSSLSTSTSMAWLPSAQSRPLTLTDPPSLGDWMVLIRSEHPRLNGERLPSGWFFPVKNSYLSNRPS